jgi:hypothetical protein
VAVARQSLEASGRLSGQSEDLFVLAKLECDKRNRALPTWIVALFDPTLTESIAAVGVDAATGDIRSMQMRAEVLNAAFITFDLDEENDNIVISIANQLRAFENHVWDISEDGLFGGSGLTASQALSMASRQLEDVGEGQNWQLGFISNTGVISTVLSPQSKSREAALMRADGAAGQWVIELFGLDAEEITDGARHGHAYAFRQFLCTANGISVTDTSSIDRVVLTSPLSRSPLPADLASSYENARTLAIKIAGPDFVVMSAGMGRAAPEATWAFVFFDEEKATCSLVISGDGYRLIEANRAPGVGRDET